MKGLEDFLNEMVDLLFKDDACQVSFFHISQSKHVVVLDFSKVIP